MGSPGSVRALDIARCVSGENRAKPFGGVVGEGRGTDVYVVDRVSSICRQQADDHRI